MADQKANDHESASARAWSRTGVGLTAIATIAIAGATIGMISCSNSSAPPSSHSQTSQGIDENTELLLDDVVSALNALPDAVNLKIRPPVVILDGRHSLDGEEILAQCLPSETTAREDGTPVYNRIKVPAGNVSFMGPGGVQPDDVIRFFIKPTEDLKEWGIGAMEYIEIPIAQVLDQHTLIIKGDLGVAVEQPEKLQIWRYIDERADEVGTRLGTYARDGTPPLHWAPSPDEVVLEQVVEWLNQWIQYAQEGGDFQPDPLLKTLPSALAKSKALAPYIGNEALTRLQFSPYEGRQLQETIWLRDVSNWARGSAIDNLGRATALFDWTIRNIQLEDSDPRRAPRLLWEVLLYGRGTAEERAWVFAGLCRQQRLDVVILGVEEAEADRIRFWLPALWSGEELHLFDTRLGLPIPGPGGQGTATLADVRQDKSLLRQLDLSADEQYPMDGKDIEHVVAQIVASPLALSHRAAVFEGRLAGADAFVLSSKPSQLAKRLADGTSLACRLWDHPFRAIRSKLLLATARSRQDDQKIRARARAALEFQVFAMRPRLWKGRVLHFEGKNKLITDERFENVTDRVESHQQAKQFYLDVRPTNETIDRAQSPEGRLVLLQAKQHATYWIGLLNLDTQQYKTAVDWLRWAGSAEQGEGPTVWEHGARYNLARAHEGLGEIDQAIALLEADNSPQRYGNRLRARQLRARTASPQVGQTR